VKKRFLTEKIKNIFKIFVSAILIAYIFLAPILVFPSIFALQNKINRNMQFDYLGILELWNVDTFEGGSVSRFKWLEKRAIEFENEHNGTFVAVINMTPEQLQLNLENGNKPDLISFGIGVGNLFVEQLKQFDCDFNIRQDIVSFGKFKSKQLAIPFMMGGYSVISAEQTPNSASVGVGLNSYTCPLLGAVLNDLSLNNLYDTNSQLSSFDAYDAYIKNDFDILVWTQRDVYRTNNRVEKSMMKTQTYLSVAGFCDLIQYVGILNGETEAKKVCEQFVLSLLTTKSQQTLKDINMFSVQKLNLYTNEPFASLEEAINQDIKSLNVFFEKSVIDDINQLCIKALGGD